MRIFNVTVKDSQSDLYILAKDCSYNQACSYLEEQNKDNRFGKYVQALPASKDVTKLTFEKRVFYYDENRGYLLTT